MVNDMYGYNCYNKQCPFNTGKIGTNKRCSRPNKVAFMMCETPKELAKQLGCFKKVGK